MSEWDLACTRWHPNAYGVVNLYTARKSFAFDLAYLHAKCATGTLRTESLQPHFHCLQINNAKKSYDDFVKPFCTFRLSSTTKEGKSGSWVIALRLQAVRFILFSQNIRSLFPHFFEFRALPSLYAKSASWIFFPPGTVVSIASSVLTSYLAHRTLSIRKSAKKSSNFH